MPFTKAVNSSLPRCKHIIVPSNIYSDVISKSDSPTNGVVQDYNKVQTETDTQPDTDTKTETDTQTNTDTQTDTNTETVNSMTTTTSNIILQKKCNAPCIKGYSYCRFHIKLYEEEYIRFLDEQRAVAEKEMQPKSIIITAKRYSKYRLADKELGKELAGKRENYGAVLDLREDMALLTILLEKILNSPKLLKHELVLRIIDQQRKCLQTMNELKKTNLQSISQEKLNNFMDSITAIINKRVQDQTVKDQIATDFIDVARDIASQKG